MTFFGLFGPPNVEKLQAKGDIKGLIKALGYEKDWQVRNKAAKALGDIGDTRAVSPLLKTLKDNDVEGAVRREVAVALGRIGNVRSARRLVETVSLC